MKHEWLTTSNFERTQEVLSAINALSIYAKLRIAGVSDPNGEVEVRQAKEDLIDFLNRLQTSVQDAQDDGDGIVTRADPRFGELAKRYLSRKQQSAQQSVSHELSIDHLRALVEQDDIKEFPMLISYLRDLRGLIEEHAHADVVALLGEI